MALLKPSNVTSQTGAYSYKGQLGSVAQNYIDNQFPNLIAVNIPNTITGSITFASGSELDMASGSTLSINTPITSTSGSITITGSLLAVNGEFSGVISSTASGTALVITNNSVIGGSLLVGSINCSGTFQASGTTTLGTVYSGTTTITGNLSATGTCVFGPVLSGNTIITGTLQVSSSVVEGTLACGNTAVNGTLSANGLTTLTGGLSVSGANYTGFTTVSGTYNVLSGDSMILVNTSSVAATINLPSAGLNSGRIIRIADTGNAGTNNITVVPHSGDTALGASSFSLSSNYDGIALWSAGGTQWYSYGFNT